MTSLSLKALECLNTLTSKLFYTRWLILYDSKTERLIAETRHSRLIYFYFTWIFLTFILWPLATLYIVVYLGILHPDRVTYDRMFFSIIVSAPGLLCNGFNYSFLTYREEIVNYINLLLDLKDYWSLEQNSYENKKRLGELLIIEWNKLKDRSPGNDIDFVGAILVLVACFLPCIPIIYIPGPFLTRADPFSYPVQVLTGYDNFPIWLYIPFRYVPAVGAVICTMEAVRAIGMVFVMMVIACHVTATLLARIETISRNDLSTGMKKYALMYKIHVKSIQPCARLAFVAVQGGICIAVLSLSGTLVGWKILSPLLYFLNPVMATFTLIIIAIGLPFAIHSAQQSSTMLRKWRFRIGECSKGSRAVNLRKLKSFQPIAFYMSAKGYMTVETKREMFEKITGNTVDTILMIMGFIN